MIIIASIPFVTKNIIVIPMAIQKNIKPIILFIWLQINSYYCIVLLYDVEIKCSTRLQIKYKTRRNVYER